MCWIFGYMGGPKGKNAENVILSGLARLEYRGYDSAGIAVFSESTGVDQFKSLGQVQLLTDLVNGSKSPKKNYQSGIGHTRWATHGRVTIENTHPHTDAHKEYFVVHNGIIENHVQLRSELHDQEFYGDTDTEVVVKLLSETPGDTLLERVTKLIPRLHGSFALLIMSTQNVNEMIWVRRGSPLILAHGKWETYYMASDTNAVSGLVKSVTYLEDDDIVEVCNGVSSIYKAGVKVTRAPSKFTQNKSTGEKGKFEHYMLKEIYEAPNVLIDVFNGRIQFVEGTIAADALKEIRDLSFDRVEFIACGTSYHAGLLGSYWIEEISDLDTWITIASEFFSRTPRVLPTTLFVFISQSWETADLIEPLKWLKEHGAHTFWVVNTEGSTIARLTDSGIFTRAWVEVGVASTKAYIAQIGVMLIMSIFFSIQSGADYRVYRMLLSGIQHISLLADEVLKLSGTIQSIAKVLAKYEHMLFLGRGQSYAIALEAALKFKEITYLHAHATPLWEIKHGTLALIDPECPCIIFLPDDVNFELNLTSISEIQARSWKVCVISQTRVENADWNIVLPKCHPVFFGFLAGIAGQLLAYYSAHSLGREIDRPRNLAKSVTVK